MLGVEKRRERVSSEVMVTKMMGNDKNDDK
jgi:hypothetical protein